MGGQPSKPKLFKAIGVLIRYLCEMCCLYTPLHVLPFVLPRLAAHLFLLCVESASFSALRAFPSVQLGMEAKMLAPNGLQP